MPFVKKKSVKPTQLRPNSDPTPSFVRFQKICTFADVGKYPQRSPTDSGMINFFYIMSKGNMLLGHARGKVGSLVFSRANGKQIVRSRAEVVKNPKTQAQMMQRILLNTIAQAYSHMQPIVDHSFEGVASGQASMSFFMQRNLNAIRTKVAENIAAGKTLSEIYDFTPLKSNTLALNVYEIAKGTLTVIRPISMESATSMHLRIDGTTYEDFINAYGLQRGDQITFVTIEETASYGRTFNVARVILDPRESDGTEAPLTTTLISNGAINKPSDRNEGSFSTLTAATDGFNFAIGSGNVLAAAVIVSRKKADGSWLRSNSQLVFNEAATYDKISMQSALDMLADTSISGLSSMYLNNAGVGNVTGSTESGNNGGGTGGGPSTEG